MDSPCNNPRNTQSKFHPVRLQNGKSCEFKKHYNGCLRQVIGFLDSIAVRDPERFVWCGLKTIVKNAKKWPERRPYSARQVLRAIQEGENDGLLKVAWKNRNGWRAGFVVAEHDAVATSQGRWCVRSDDHAYLVASRPKHQKRHATSRSQVSHNPAPSDTTMSSPMSSEISEMSSAMSSHMSSPMSSESNFDVITDVITNSPQTQNQEAVNEGSHAALAVGLAGPSLVEPYQALFSLEKAALCNPEEPPSFALKTNSNSDNAGKEELIKIGSVFAGELGVSVDYVSDREFDEDFLTRYEHATELQACLEQAIEELAHEPYLGRQTNARVMYRTMTLMRSVHDLDVPRGWVPTMKQLQSNSSGNYIFTSKEPNSVRESYELLTGINPPYWYLTNGYITESECEALGRLSIKDFDHHPEFRELLGEQTIRESAQREAEVIAEAKTFASFG